MKTEANDLINPVKEAAENMYAFKTVGGLTKREYFAAMAMQGILAAQTATGYLDPNTAASMAVRQATRLIRLLNAEESK